VSVDSSGSQAGSDSSYNASVAISANGQIVAFQSDAANLVAGDTNAVADTFVYDLGSGITDRVSIDSSDNQGNAASGLGTSMSADGRVIGFSSHATNLVDDDTNGLEDVFVHEACSTIASWSTYGTGFPGTNGVPSLTAQSNPVLGSSLTVDLASSSNLYTAAVLFVGYQQAQIHSAWGGDLLLLPAIASLIALPPTGTSLTGDLPDDEAFCGFEVDLQAIEADAGAAKGVSFTPGLQLILGR
jgi:hypothetical protein